MKKIILNLICALLMVSFIPTKAFAVGGFSVSTTGVTLHPGESTSFSVTASNAAGRVNISSSDPSIASVSTSAVFLDLNSESVTITAGSIGSTTISIVTSSNFATYDEENLGGQTRTISVNVVEVPKPTPAPQPTTTPAPAPVAAPSSQNNDSGIEQPSSNEQSDDPNEADETIESKTYTMKLKRETTHEGCPECEMVECPSQTPVFMIIAIIECLGIVGMIVFLVLRSGGKNEGQR